jgi:hypothetical protein
MYRSHQLVGTEYTQYARISAVELSTSIYIEVWNSNVSNDIYSRISVDTSDIRQVVLYTLHNTIASEELQNLGLCSALRAFEQGRIFIMPHML